MASATSYATTGYNETGSGDPDVPNRVWGGDGSHISDLGFHNTSPPGTPWGPPYVPGISDYLWCQNCGFSLPPGTVQGIEVSFLRHGYYTGGSDAKLFDNRVYLVYGTNRVGIDFGGSGDITTDWWVPTNSTSTYGGPSEMWESGLTSTSQINDSSFGVALQVYSSGGTYPYATGDLLQANITVYYTETTTSAIAEPITGLFSSTLNELPWRYHEIIHQRKFMGFFPFDSYPI